MYKNVDNFSIMTSILVGLIFYWIFVFVSFLSGFQHLIFYCFQDRKTPMCQSFGVVAKF